MGIRRKGGGRKKSKDSGVPHLKREWGSKHVPLHVTAKLADDLPSLRTGPCFRVIEKAFRAGRERPGRRADGEFRLIEYSIQEGRVGPGRCRPGPPTDPDVRNSRIRLLRGAGSLRAA
jgi:hypothetical protein